MELRHYWSILWRWMWLIVLATGIAAVSSYLVVSQQPKIYQTSTTLLVGQSIQALNPTPGDIYMSQQLAQTYVQLVKTEAVLQGVVDALGLQISAAALRGMVSAIVIQGTQLIELRVIDTDPLRAQAVANETARQLILQGPAAKEQELQSRQNFVQKQADELQKKIQEGQERINELQSSIQVTASAREIADKQQQIATLQQQINQWQLTYANLLNYLTPRSPSYITVIEPARVPTTPVAPNVPMTVMLAAAIGALLAIGGAFLIEYIDDTVKTPDDITQSLKMTLLAVIARIAGDAPEEKLVAARHPRSSHAEAYRLLRTNIQVADVDRPVQTILVTSPNPVEGKSVTAANLAVVMAQAGLRTVLVDADLRRPTQHRLFRLTNDIGLTNSLVQSAPNLDGYARATDVENLRVVTTGPLPPNPAELLGSKRMQKLVEALKDQADVIIFDTPPCLPLADAAILARQVDGVVLVTDAGKTRRDAVVKAKEALERAGGRVLGTVLNR
ncbi:MAG: polysaccharide biosynthesis tyrosine autokinase, partial [Anaerolineae bacterium]|nr:polysaccharide biosynthesis tyrosine autokinase [Anaerolineae bacterium]